jgi:hypothetical protein
MSVRSAALLIMTTVLCVSFFSTAEATKLAGEFLATGFGARALGMGGAFVSIADDASAVYWNPAGLVQIEQSQILLMHSERFGNLVDYNCFSMARPLSTDPGREATGAISVIWLRVSDIAFTSHLNEPGVDFIDSDDNGVWDPGERRLWRPDRVRWESDNEVAGYLSYSKRLNPRTSIGVNAKIIWKEIADITSLAFGLDAGILYQVVDNWKLGVNLQDFTGTPLYWDGWYYSADAPDAKYKISTKETIYPTIKVGTSYAIPMESIAGKVIFAADCDFKFEGLAEEEADFSVGEVSGDVRLGAVYEYRQTLRIAAGMDRQKLSAGIGLMTGRFGLDYAFWRDSEIDNTHRVSVSMNL